MSQLIANSWKKRSNNAWLPQSFSPNAALCGFIFQLMQNVDSSEKSIRQKSWRSFQFLATWIDKNLALELRSPNRNICPTSILQAYQCYFRKWSILLRGCTSAYVAMNALSIIWASWSRFIIPIEFLKLFLQFYCKYATQLFRNETEIFFWSFLIFWVIIFDFQVIFRLAENIF